MGSQTIDQLVSSADPQLQQYVGMLRDRIGQLETELSGVKTELSYLNRALWGARNEENLHRAIDSDLNLIPGGTVRNDLPPVSDE
jgi:hypothetical protein